MWRPHVLRIKKKKYLPSWTLGMWLEIKWYVCVHVLMEHVWGACLNFGLQSPTKSHTTVASKVVPSMVQTSCFYKSLSHFLTLRGIAPTIEAFLGICCCWEEIWFSGKKISVPKSCPSTSRQQSTLLHLLAKATLGALCTGSCQKLTRNHWWCHGQHLYGSRIVRWANYETVTKVPEQDIALKLDVSVEVMGPHIERQ